MLLAVAMTIRTEASMLHRLVVLETFEGSISFVINLLLNDKRTALIVTMHFIRVLQ